MADSRTLLFLVPPLFLLFVIPEVSAEICAPENKDVKVLKDQDYWQFEVQKGLPGCTPFKPPEVLKDSSTCLFYFSICKPVPTFCPQNSGICLMNKVDYRPKYNKTLYSEPQDIGSFKEGKNPFTSAQKYFTLKFNEGEAFKYKEQMVEPVTEIRFNCKQNATWESGDHKAPQPSNITHIFSSGGILIMYLIEFDYKGACTGGGGGGGGGSDEEPTKPLSVGSILLILFFPGLFLYCVVGALINRGAGKTGKEMIPNSKFWTELPGLISDGFSFVVAKITCSDMSTSQQTYDRM